MRRRDLSNRTKMSLVAA